MKKFIEISRKLSGMNVAKIVISRIIGQKYRDREMVEPRSKEPNRNFRPQATKTGKKYRRETFGTIGAKF